MMKQTLGMAVVAIGLMISTTACEKKNDATPAPTVTTDSATLTVSADAANGSYTYFNLRTKATVTSAQQQSTDWDFGMLFTNLVANATPNGPGTGGVQVVDGTLAGITAAPETGYVATITDYTQWANYNSTTRTFSPRPGRIIVFRTADNKYVKLEMLAADYGPLAGTPPRPTTIIYRFRYTIQTNGTRNF
ncbi:MAG: HmuY family protein [Chitinophagaceae bacterium]